MQADRILVLCAEDNPLHQKLLQQQLQTIDGRACDFEFAATESAAWVTFHLKQPDAILIDYQLAEGNGLSLIRRIRAVDPLVPIVAVSGMAPAEVAAELVQSGADDYLDKRDLEVARLARSLFAAMRRAEAFRQRLPSPNHAESDPLVERVRRLHGFLTELGADTLLAHLEALEAAVHAAGSVDKVAAVFKQVCCTQSLTPNVARRVMRPFLLEAIAALSSASNLNL